MCAKLVAREYARIRQKRGRFSFSTNRTICCDGLLVPCAWPLLGVRLLRPWYSHVYVFKCQGVLSDVRNVQISSCPKLSSPPRHPLTILLLLLPFKNYCQSHSTMRIKFSHPRTIKYYSLYSVCSPSLTLVENLKLLILDNNV
jgi:hypothetical protein